MTRLLVRDHVLGARGVDALVEWFAAQPTAVPATLGSDPSDHQVHPAIRSALVVSSGAVEALDSALPDVAAALRAALDRATRDATAEFLDPFEATGIESVGLVYGNGGHYIEHVDRTPTTWRTRRLSWTYYVARDPARFAGGRLAFRDGPRVPPVRDRLCVFHPDEPHAVEPVACWGRERADGRLVLNGWVWGPEEAA